MFALTIASCALGLIAIVLLIVFRPRPNNNLFALSTKLDDLFKKLDALTIHMREDLRLAREENAGIAAQNRKELNDTLINFRREMQETLQLITEQNRAGVDTVNKTLDNRISDLVQKVATNNKESREALAADLSAFTLVQKNKMDEWRMLQKEGAKQIVEQLDKITQKVDEKLLAINEQGKADAHQMRLSLEASFKGFSQTFTQSVEGMNNLQREKFGQMEEKQHQLVQTTEKKLEEMRHTVDEKLQKTLNDRLGQSFELVRGQLESVQKGLGEMQTLAQDVGGLKKVLSNVKMRGGFGEVQLHMLLENILAPEQYEANVITKAGSAERVEFAVKFPNKEGDRDYVWLPIDAKFPKDAYETLQVAYEGADHAAIESAQKGLEAVIRKMAKDICEKYIDAPNTTSFGIMFLPFEGLFAEVVRKASLLEEIQRDCKVVITGPTTLAVILNSLQMGFRTLAIQKRSSEVWQVLGTVKKEFSQFGVLLDKAQKNIQTGLNQLDDVVGARTRAIQRRLKNVEILEEGASETPLLSDLTSQELLDDTENI
ncbi:MAG TPA: DNA recombination protein RmuC [Flavisolibacter sp.]|jgi:DNA recombination protein RmuC|nr:DNA recombination protein RmuC [Flavisolibacter sp.]